MVDLQKFNLRVPKDLYEEAAELADYQRISVNALMVAALRNFLPFEQRRVRRPRVEQVPLTPGVAASTADLVSSATSVVGVNQPCPCGSGQKYKRCHGKL